MGDNFSIEQHELFAGAAGGLAVLDLQIVGDAGISQEGGLSEESGQIQDEPVRS